MSDLFRLDNQVVAVIGAGSGIGEAVAMGAASQGAEAVWCLDLNEASAARVAQAIEGAGGVSRAAALDIGDEVATVKALDAIRSAHARLDALVCTPAINVRKPILTYTGEEFDRVVRINL